MQSFLSNEKLLSIPTVFYFTPKVFSSIQLQRYIVPLSTGKEIDGSAQVLVKYFQLLPIIPIRYWISSNSLLLEKNGALTT
jgi:hypothetical protein